uniref:7TM_GPCR_Srx domain-containing protein n=1 Tax=Panagrellus redivivus TaxID=6233 RepID=A0A7E4VYC0_PANRE
MFNILFETLCFQHTGQNAYILWITGMAMSVALELIPVSLAFLSLERCLGMHLPVNSLNSRQHVLRYCVVILFTIVTSSLAVVHFYTAFPKDWWTACVAFACLATSVGNNLYVGFRVLFGSLNITMGIILFILIRHQLTKSHLAVRLNRLILLSLLVIIAFDIVPNFGMVLTGRFLKLYLHDFAPVSGIVSAFDNFVVALVFKNCFNKTKITPLGHDQIYTSSLAKRMIQVNQF